MLALFGIGHGMGQVWAQGDPSVIKFDFPALRSAGNVVESMGRGRLTYGPWTMDADMMTFSKDTGLVKLIGNVEVKGQGVAFETVFVEVNVKTKTGHTGSLSGEWFPTKKPDVITDAAPERTIDFASRHYFVRADHAELGSRDGGEKAEVILRSVSLTDCDADQPHQDFFIGKMRWAEDYRVEIQHLTPRLGGVPYFYLPWLGRDMSRDWPWTRWTLGSKSDWGRYAIFETLLLPESTQEDLRLNVGVRQDRGASLGLNWERVDGRDRQRLDVQWMHERWEKENITLESELWRLDWEERRQLSRDWTLSLDLHLHSSRDQGVWSGNSGLQVSPDLYASPFGANVLALQERESFLQDYDQERWETGRLDENELALEYQDNGRYFKLGTLYPSDGELLVGRTKALELRGHQLYYPLNDAWTLSAESGFALVGQRLGWELSDADLMTLSGNLRRKHYQTWRSDGLLKLENRVAVGPLTFRPWLGYRVLAYGDVLRDASIGKAFYDMDERSDLDGSMWHQRLLGGLATSSTISGWWKQGRLLHQVRPNLALNLAGPTGWNQGKVISVVDEVDLEKRPELELVWGVEQEWLRGESRRLLYFQSLEFRQLFHDRDKDLLYGQDRLGGTDLRFHHALYPSRYLSAYNEVQMNSIHRQVPWVRTGFNIHKSGHLIDYGFNYRKDLRVPSKVSNRHDVMYRYTGRWDDVSLMLSWDGDQQPSVFKQDDFYRRGFRRFDVVWGHLFHCLRTEFEFEYDFEDSGATFIFRFGPELFRNHLPHLREGVRGL